MSRLVVMCVDALFTTDLEDAARMEGFAAIMDHAGIYKNIECVYPTLTYPCHATIMSGCWPDRHGICHNEKLDPKTNNREWYWNYKDLTVKTIFDYAKENNLTTAAFEWPVTAGADIDYMIPEMWTYDHTPDMREVLLPNSSPAMKEIYEKNCHIMNWKENPRFDSFQVQCAVDIIHRYNPDVLFMHQSHLDHTRHVYGLHAPEVQEALRLHDGWIRQVIEALKEEELFEDTTFIILGDHGHLQVDYNICPNVLLAREGIVRTDGAGNIREWDAYIQSCGISAQVYIKKQEAEGIVLRLLGDLKDLGYVRDIFTKEEVKEKFHLDGEFSYMIEAAPNYAFGNAACGDLLAGTDTTDYKYSVATHGHLPARGDKPCFIVRGAGVPEGVFEGARLVDEAPTMMKILGLSYGEGEMDGAPLF